MKPKLLITLGCSWTEGVGCYEPQINYNTNNPMSEDDKEDIVRNLYNKNLENFHKDGWPNRVGKKLGFDKVINLGCGGASHSSSIKLLYEYFEENNVSQYDVLLIWLMTEPSRFSFYVGGKIKNFLTGNEVRLPIMTSYLNTIENLTLDPLLEQKFYLKTLENFCESKGIYLITTSWNETFPDLYKLYHSKSYLHKKSIQILPPFVVSDDGYLINYSYCSHPNHQGYEWISDEIVRGIKENHSKWYSDKQNENIEWEFKGIPKKRKLNLI